MSHGGIKLTHDDLVEFGRKWLSSRSPVVITEIASAASEEPDVIGFMSSYKIGHGTVLLECKVSRQDFNADKKKHYRRNPKDGIGNHRYFLAPKDLIKVNELPEKWGLLECSEKGRIKIIKKSDWQEGCEKKHNYLLLSLLRRLKVDSGEHASIKVYTSKTKNRATLTLEN